MQMKSVVILGDGEEIRCVGLGTWVPSWSIATASALDYSHLDYFMKTEPKKPTFIQFKPVNLESFSYSGLASTVGNTKINPMIIIDFFIFL